MTTRPAYVALARGILEAAALAAIGVLITWLTETDLGSLAPYAPAGVLLLRQLEGLVDERIDPSKPRRAPGRVLAGTTAVKSSSTRGAISTAMVVVIVLLVLILLALLGWLEVPA